MGEQNFEKEAQIKRAFWGLLGVLGGLGALGAAGYYWWKHRKPVQYGKFFTQYKPASPGSQLSVSAEKWSQMQQGLEAAKQKQWNDILKLLGKGWLWGNNAEAGE